MPNYSASYKKLELRINKEIIEIINARDAICPNKAGKPAQRKGAAIIKAGVVLLSAIFEAFVENLCKEAMDKLYKSKHPDKDINEIKDKVIDKNHNAGIYQVNNLFFYVEIPWIMNKIKWRKCSNKSVKEKLQKLATARNKIAHNGGQVTIQKQQLVSWYKFILTLSQKIDNILFEHIKEKTKKDPW